MSIQQKTHPGVYALAIAAFAIGIAEFVVVGILPSLATAFQISLSRAGGLVGFYALALAVGTPVLVLCLARIPRKALLLGLIAVFLAGNLVSALAGSYAVLLTGRMITTVAHGSFFAIGATVAAHLAPKGQAGKAIALMFAGLTLAMVIGVPLGSFIGNAANWRLPFFAVAALAALAWLATLRLVPAIEVHADGTLAEQLAALRQPAILTMMTVTVLGFGASFAAFTFVTPILTAITGFSTNSASVLLVVFGLATLIGNLAGGRWAVTLGWRSALRRMILCLLLAFIILTVAMSHKVAMVPMLFIWGALAFGMSPAFQAGMLETAERYAPRAVGFASALNIAGFNLGITLGQNAGSVLVSHELLAFTPLASAVLSALALLPLSRLRSNTPPTHNT